MRLWVTDLLAAVSADGLTDEEFGIYMRLLLVAWEKDGIPTDPKERARLVSATPSRLAKLWPAIEDKWVSNGNGKLVNPRMEREREEAKKLAGTRSEAARKAAEARWSQ
jgi:uncharacterized protein YdaU (DUF1376 family)